MIYNINGSIYSWENGQLLWLREGGIEQPILTAGAAREILGEIQKQDRANAKWFESIPVDKVRYYYKYSTDFFNSIRIWIDDNTDLDPFGALEDKTIRAWLNTLIARGRL